MSSGGASRRGSSYRIPLDSTQAIYARDAVSKSIYKVHPLVFEFLIAVDGFRLDSSSHSTIS